MKSYALVLGTLLLPSSLFASVVLSPQGHVSSVSRVTHELSGEVFSAGVLVKLGTGSSTTSIFVPCDPLEPGVDCWRTELLDSCPSGTVEHVAIIDEPGGPWVAQSLSCAMEGEVGDCLQVFSLEPCPPRVVPLP